MLKIFIGYDERQPISFNVLQHSIVTQATVPVAIIPLRISQLPIKRIGLTPFTYSRFLVPYLCGYEGVAVFLDVDIILNGDIAELFNCVADPEKAVYVSKNEQKFEWASVMVFNCAHPDNKKLTPEYVETADNMHRIGWTSAIGDLPREWNHLVGYDAPKEAKLIHFTQGVPAYPETVSCEYGDLWWDQHRELSHTLSWPALMGNSVHAVIVNDQPLPKFLFDLEKQKPKPEYEQQVRKLLGA